MNFTREPIIETIISPKEGCKLLIRSSKATAEEFYVDAVEVVSFGRAFFFRSLERPKAFLVPVSDYEVLEVKEVRVPLKNISHERNIKIGGGRDAPLRQKETPPETEPQNVAEEPEQTTEEPETALPSRMDKRRDRRRRRHRRSGDEQDWKERHNPQTSEQKAQGGGAEDEAKVSSPMFSSLIPPPSTLISQTLSRLKDKELVEDSSPKEIEPKEEKKKKDEDDTTSGSMPLSRVSTTSENAELSPYSSIPFSTLQDDIFY